VKLAIIFFNINTDNITITKKIKILNCFFKFFTKYVYKIVNDKIIAKGVNFPPKLSEIINKIGSTINSTLENLEYHNLLFSNLDTLENLGYRNLFFSDLDRKYPKIIKDKEAK